MKTLNIKNVIKKEISIKLFDQRKDKILIYRQYGGLGDILMARMLFEDLKKIKPENKIYFACPNHLIPAVDLHPYLNGVFDFKSIKTEEFITFDISNVCTRYESFKGVHGDKHRSDIWAESIGISLENHNMHLSFRDDEINFAKKIIKENTVVIAPYSAMPSKNLLPKHLNEICKFLKNYNLNVIGLHNKEIEELKQFNIPTLTNLTIREWMSVINECSYVISVDTAAFHMANGLNKPTVGIFSWANGKLYSKYHNNAIIVQLNLSENCPCYNFASCPLSNKAIKPCIQDLDEKIITDAIKIMIENNK